MLKLFWRTKEEPDESSNNNGNEDSLTSSSDPNVSPQPQQPSTIINDNGFDTIDLNDNGISLKQHPEFDIRSEDYITSNDDENENENENISDNEVKIDDNNNISHSLEWRTVIFIRHGNSIWNENKIIHLKVHFLSKSNWCIYLWIS